MQPPVRGFLKLVREGSVETQATSRAGQAGWTEVYAWAHAVDSPRDAASGRPTGKRRHGPLIVTRPIDPTSQQLMAALVDGVVFAEVVVETWRPTASSERQRPDASDLLDLPLEKALDLYVERLRQSRLEGKRGLTIRLLDASVTSIETEMVDGVVLEHVAFDYRRIAWSWGEAAGELTVANDSAPAAPTQPRTPADTDDDTSFDA